MNRPQNENREFERIGVRTAATAIIPYGPSWVACRAWTDDLSPGGARVLTERQITGQQFFIRVQLEGLSHQVFHCEIRRQGEKSFFNCYFADREYEKKNIRAPTHIPIHIVNRTYVKSPPRNSHAAAAALKKKS